MQIAENNVAYKTKNEKIDGSLFAEKVIKYLWDDAFKFKRDDIFVKEYGSLEEIIEIQFIF